MQGNDGHRTGPDALPLPQALLRHLGRRSVPAREIVRELSRALAKSPEAYQERLIGQFFAPLGKLADGGLPPNSPPAKSLDRAYGVKGPDPQPALLLCAVQTYYALVVKLTVWHRLAAGPIPGTVTDELSPEDGSLLRRRMEELESGETFRSLGLLRFVPPGPWSWYLDAWSPWLQRGLCLLIGKVNRLVAAGPESTASHAGDAFRELYQDLIPKQVRHALGEYYTPDWLAEYLLEETGFDGRPGPHLLDPACGSGAFLVAAIRRIRRPAESTGLDAEHRVGLVRKIRETVVGFDLNPLAVLAARANYLLALGEWVRDAGPIEIPVLLRDAILDDTPPAGPHAGAFDFIVGNPPWIAWDHLPQSYREATKDLWKRYGLFSLSGNAARHGGGKKDLAMLLLYAAADRHLKDGGRLGFVITQTLLQTRGAGDGFRRFRLGPDGQHLKVLRAADLVDVQPFEEAANWTGTLVLEKGSPTTYPVPYTRWSQNVGHVSNVPTSAKNPARWNRAPHGFCKRLYHAEPIEPARPTSPWFVRPEGFSTGLGRLVGPSDYQAHLGANSGGANGVYWLEILDQIDGGVMVRNTVEKSKRSLPAVEAAIEEELLYPLLRWADVARFRTRPSGHVLIAQDVQTRRGIDEALMQKRWPLTHAYLKRFEPLLRRRAAFRKYQSDGPFYSMYNVGPYTVAPIKVVWRRMDRRVNAAVVGERDDPLLGPRPVVPQETCVLVAVPSVDEAHYLCALLNSAVADFLVRAHSVRGGKGFGSPGMLDYLNLRRFQPDDPRHAELSQLSRRAHDQAGGGEDTTGTQHRIDQLAAAEYHLPSDDLALIQAELNTLP